MSGKIPTALGLTGGIASAWPRLTTLVFQGRGHFFMYIPYSRLAEASSKQAWQDHLRTLTYPNVLHCPVADPPNLRRGFVLGYLLGGIAATTHEWNDTNRTWSSYEAWENPSATALAVFLNAAAGAFFCCRPPICHLRRRLVGESGKVFEGEWIKWTLTYLYLTMIELAEPPRG